MGNPMVTGSEKGGAGGRAGEKSNGGSRGCVSHKQ